MKTMNRFQATLHRHRSKSRALSSAGLTLIEVLVSISIVTILIVLVVSSLRATGSSARSAICQNQLRQMAMAANIYAMTYRHYPTAIRWSNQGSNGNGQLWEMAWDYEHAAGQNVRPGAMWEFTDDPGRVHQCPEYHGPSSPVSDPYSGYNYNTTYVGGEAPYQKDWDDANFRPSLRFGRCRRCATTAMFGDGGRPGGTNKFMRAPGNTVEGNLWVVYSGGQAFRHNGATNVAYLDGSVGSVSAPSPGVHANENLLGVLGYPKNGFLSNDDRAYDPF